MNRLRVPVLGVMLSVATMGAFNGCTTLTPWRTIGTEQRQLGIEKRVTENKGTKEVSTKEFSISDAYVDGEEYKTDITESLIKTTYNLKEEAKVKRVRDITIEQREQKTEILGPFLFGTLTVAGAIGGVAVGANLDEDEPLKKIGGGLLGALGGALLGVWLGEHAPKTTKTEVRRQEREARDIVSDQKTNETFLRKDLIYSDKPGANVRFGIAEKSQTYQTDSNGIIEWKITKPRVFASRESLEKRLYEFPLVQEIKPVIRDSLKERLLNLVSSFDEQIAIETRENSFNPNSEAIKNCKKTLNFTYYTLKDEDVYKLAKEIVDEKINSSIRKIKFNVKDDLTHVPISNTNIEFSTNSPSKSSLLGRYFTGGLKAYSERFIPNYLFGEGTAQLLPDSFEWTVYSPSNIFLEVTHPDYNFVSGEIAADGNTRRTIYMVDKGSKVRLQNAEESTGRIEE